MDYTLKDINSKQSKIILTFAALIGLLSLISVLFLRSNKINTSKSLNSLEVDVSERPVKSDADSVKLKMMASTDPRVVVSGILVNYYPPEQLVLSNNGTFPFNFYGVELTERQYSILVDYFQSIRQNPPMDFDLSDILHHDFIPLAGVQDPPWKPSWYTYWHNSGNNLVTTDGFVCLYPFAEEKIDGLWRPSNYESQFVAHDPLVFRCTYMAEPTENSTEKVAKFIANFLNSEGIAQVREQDIIEAQTEDYTYRESFGINTESFKIAGYSASAGYTDKYNQFNSELKNAINSELDELLQLFISADWQARIKEVTNPRLLRNWYAMNLTATNHMYECRIEVALWGDEYIEYYPKEKSRRIKYPEYSDEEYEKNVLGGEIRRSTVCFKSLKFPQD